MSEAFSELRRIVERVLDLPEGERGAELARECGEDAELLADARALLDSSVAEGDFLEPPVRPDRAGPVLPEGAAIGAYRLVRVVASGGMGTVYEAVREDPRRRAALKVMRAGLGSPASVARFRYEVEVLASLRHPGVAHMFESGVHVVEVGPVRHELPWFAMELVEKPRPITRFAREDGLKIAERLELFCLVCEAVQHGHSKGVIHRDLKPDNVLVGEDGRPKVIDFGVARALESGSRRGTVLTSHGEIVGTLAYMSPEQVSARPDSVDARSDVYSLGILLYELTTDALPYDLSGKSLVESARIISEESPRRPSAVAPRTAGDLEAILLRCLEKDPARRYASAASLEEDVRRMLRYEPIEARPPSVSYRVSRFVRRHRVLVASAALVALVLVASTVTSLGFLAGARRSEKVARDREAQARSERDRSRALFEKLLDRSVTAAFDLAPEIRDLPGGLLLSSEVISGAILDLEALEADAGGEPRVRLRIGFAHLRLGDVRGNPAYPNVGDRQGAVLCYERAREIAEALVGHADLGPEPEKLLAVSERRLGEMEVIAGRMEEARRRMENARAMLDAVASRYPADRTLRAELGTTHDKLGVVAARTGDLRGAHEHVESYSRIFRELAELDPEDEGFSLQVALARQQLAGVFYGEGEFERARAEWSAILPMFSDIAAAHPEVTQHRKAIAWTQMWLGTTEDRLGRPEDARRWLEEALAGYRTLLRDDPLNDQYPPSIGNILWILGGLDEVRERIAGPGSAEAAAALKDAVGRYREAAALYERLREQGRLQARQGGAADAIRQRLSECLGRLKGSGIEDVDEDR